MGDAELSSTPICIMDIFTSICISPNHNRFEINSICIFNVLQELKDFFQRAIRQREEREKAGLIKKSSQEKSPGMFIFSNGDAIATAGTARAPGIVEVRSKFPTIMGFELVIARVSKVDLNMYIVYI